MSRRPTSHSTDVAPPPHSRKSGRSGLERRCNWPFVALVELAGCLYLHMWSVAPVSIRCDAPAGVCRRPRLRTTERTHQDLITLIAVVFLAAVALLVPSAADASFLDQGFGQDGRV